MTPIVIDGSYGEGGGQMLRTALTLSLLTGKPFQMVNIRAGREKPGLRAQHLEAVRAAQRIAGAEVEGAKEGAMAIWFRPGLKIGGAETYHFEIRTAGSTSLVLQTIFLPLALAGKPVRVTIGGGTHVEWSPSFHYLALQWLPTMKRMGFDATLTLPMAGFYPRGGGTIECAIRPCAQSVTVQAVYSPISKGGGGLFSLRRSGGQDANTPLSDLDSGERRPPRLDDGGTEPLPQLLPLIITDRGAPRVLRLRSVIGQLPLEIAERQEKQAKRRLASLTGYRVESEIVPVPAPSPGTMLLAMAEHEHGAGCFCALGAKGKRAEKVADEACDGLLGYLQSDAAVDEFLGDQLVLPAVLARGETRYRTKITQHLLTNLHVMKLFLPVTASVEGNKGEVGTVFIAANLT